jgi:hypothetical protein
MYLSVWSPPLVWGGLAILNLVRYRVYYSCRICSPTQSYTPPSPLAHCLRTYTVLFHTGKGGGVVVNQRGGEWQQGRVQITKLDLKYQHHWMSARNWLSPVCKLCVLNWRKCCCSHSGVNVWGMTMNGLTSSFLYCPHHTAGALCGYLKPTSK